MAKHVMALKQNSSTPLIGGSIVVRGTDYIAGISTKPSCCSNCYYCGANVSLAAVLLFRHYFATLACALHIFRFSFTRAFVNVLLLLLLLLLLKVCLSSHPSYAQIHILLIRHVRHKFHALAAPVSAFSTLSCHTLALHCTRHTLCYLHNH